jgi:hypothetical protein
VTPSRLAEYISVRTWYWDLSEHWDAALADVGLSGLTLDAIGKDRIHRIVAGISIVAVESAVRQRRFRNGSYLWQPNDIHDLSFIGHPCGFDMATRPRTRRGGDRLRTSRALGRAPDRRGERAQRLRPMTEDEDP